MTVETATMTPASGPDPLANGQHGLLEEHAPAELLDDIFYEVVNGQIEELSPMAASETMLASDLTGFLYQYGREKDKGRAAQEMLFLLDAVKKLKRRPDVAFVSYERWPKTKRVPRTNAWAVVPELAVEVVSETNTAEKILAKIRQYFQAGSKRVWVVYPTEEQVYVYQSPTQTVILTRDGALDGEDFLPGFRLPLNELFAETSE